MQSSIKSPCDETQITATKHTGIAAPSTGFWILLATILGSSMSFIDGTVVNVALPSLQRDFGATIADVQWVVEAYALFLASLILVGGALGDRLGRRRIFSLGIIIFSVASAACWLAPTLLILILARAVQGIGGALLVPGSLAIIGASFPTERKGAAIGSWSAFTTITSALGPLLGGWLVQAASWRWVFFINLPIAAITLFITMRHVPESRSHETSRLDIPGTLLATFGLGSLVYGFITASAIGLGAWQVMLALAIGVIALAAFIWVEAHSDYPMVSLSLFRSRNFSGANLLTFLLYGALGGALYFLPFNLQQVQGYSPAASGAALLPLTVILFSLSRWTGSLVTRVGAKLLLVSGCVLVAIGFLLFARTGIGGSYWLTYFPAIVVFATGMSLVVAPLTTTVMNAVSSEHSGVASGINNAVSRAAGLLAICILSLIVVSVFGAAFSNSLASLNLSPSVQASLNAQHARLAGVQIPSNLSHSTQAAIQQAINSSFISGFQTAMLVGAALALAAGLAAAILIDGKPKKI